MLNEIFSIDRRLRIGHKQLLTYPFVKEDLTVAIDRYLSDFAIYHNLTAQDIVSSYDGFIKRYSEDIKDFISTGKYPISLDKKIDLSRIDYDIALILSMVTTVHRYKIIDNIRKCCSDLSGNICIVGLGSGLELAVLNLYCSVKGIESYDIHISKFVKDNFKTTEVFEQEFVGKDKYYDSIFGIELLEHLADPYHLLSICHDSLKSEGRLFITTATNIPQCDHIFNFNDDQGFTDKVCDLGFEILNKEDILHESFNDNLNAKNTWYVLGKK